MQGNQQSNPSYFDPTHPHQFHGNQPNQMQQNQERNFGTPGLNASTPGLAASSLTFTPSGGSASSSLPFRNIRNSMKSLTDNFEAVLSKSLEADSAVLEHHVTQAEKMTMDSGSIDADMKPLNDVQIDPDAEAYAIIQELLALDSFRQAAGQAFWTSKYIPHTVASHLDHTLELPQNADNPSLQSLTNAATLQVDASRKFSNSIAEGLRKMAAAIEHPTEQELNHFLRQECLYKS